mgnify:CR=1 FL=1
MKVIVLTGLVSIEKARLTTELTDYFKDDATVAIIDNIARTAIEIEDKSLQIERVEGDVISELSQVVHQINADVIIIAVSEQAHPEKLFVAIDDLREQQPEWDIYSLALIDTRTCDCFPNVREALELYADATVMIPYQLDGVLNYVSTA